MDGSREDSPLPANLLTTSGGEICVIDGNFGDAAATTRRSEWVAHKR